MMVQVPALGQVVKKAIKLLFAGTRLDGLKTLGESAGCLRLSAGNTTAANSPTDRENEQKYKKGVTLIGQQHTGDWKARQTLAAALHDLTITESGGTLDGTRLTKARDFTRLRTGF